MTFISRSADGSRPMRLARHRAIALALLAALACLLHFAPAQAQSQQQDREIIRRGEGRADLWMFYQDNDPDGSKQYKWLLRLQRPWLLPDGWKLSWRFDFPLLYTNALGPANDNGNYSLGIGDIFGQAAVTTPDILPNLSMNFGFRLVAPTGGKGPFGSSQWKAAPQLGLSYEIPLAPGYAIEISPLVRYFRGFSPTHSGVTTSREYDVYPTIALSLPDDWAILLWDENPPTYNTRTNAWFVPFDIMMIKKITPKFQLGVGAAVKLIDDNPQYKYMFYGRGSIFF